VLLIETAQRLQHTMNGTPSSQLVSSPGYIFLIPAPHMRALTIRNRTT